jgi:hypothetical protein
MKDFGTFRRIDASGFTLLLLWELTPCFLILLKFHNIPKLARRDTPIVRYFFKFVRLFSRTRQRKIYQTNSSDSPIGSSLDDSWRGSNYYGAMDSSLDSEPGSFEQVEGEAGEVSLLTPLSLLNPLSSQILPTLLTLPILRTLPTQQSQPPCEQ